VKSSFGFILAIIALAIAAALSGAMFQVAQTEQALVLRFGAPVAGRGLITQPGLHFKIPLIESVVRIDNRILDLESPKQEVIAADNQRIDVDAFVRYRIVDPLKFYQAAGSIRAANNFLASILNSSVRRVLGEATQTQIVRDDRAALVGKIKTQVNNESMNYGIAIIDARLRRADLPREISEKVFSRMQSERKREANEYRAQGNEQYQTITSRADRDAIVLKAEAQRKADTVRGEGDGERNQVFAEVYGKDPEFFAFYRSMLAYDQSFKAGDTRFVTSPNSDFFKYFGNPSGK